MTLQKNVPQGQIFIEISPQAKATCGAATVFQVICGNPHVMHKETWFLPSDAFLMECNPEEIVRTLSCVIKNE
jgi:hypothetical protein